MTEPRSPSKTLLHSTVQTSSDRCNGFCQRSRHSALFGCIRYGYRVAGYHQLERLPPWRSWESQVSVLDDDAPRHSVCWLCYAAKLIGHGVWLYFRFPLSLRMVEEMLAARGISVTYETVRRWGLKFGGEFANRIHRRAPSCGDKWHIDEVVITIAGKALALERGRPGGVCFRCPGSEPARQKGAKRLFRKLLKKQRRAPRVLITAKLKSYAMAKRRPYLASSIGSTRASTTGRRILTNRRDDESGS
jgi:transposase-like protein